MATTLNQWEVGPFNAGVNASMIPTEIDDNEAVVIQDMLLDKPGIIYARGPVQNVVQASSTFNLGSRIPKGFFSTNSPDGLTHLGSVTQDPGSTNLYFTTLNDAGNAIGISVTLDSAFPLTSDCIVDAKPALGGGLWIGTQELKNAANANVAGRQSLFHWRGATKAAYSTGTIAVTAGSPTVTGTGTTWTTNVVPGMFLIFGAGTYLLGVVKSVNSNTSITLETNVAIQSPGTSSGLTYELQPIRGWGSLEVAKGRISTTTSSTTVIGSGTKFLSQNLISPAAWYIYRAKDNVLVGSVSTISGDEGLTLGGNAAVAMDNEPYVARTFTAFQSYDVYTIPTTIPTSSGAFPGVFNTTYAGLQWFARQDGPTAAGTGDMHSRLWFSDYRNMNSIDLLTQDGDFIQVASTVGQNRPITGISALTNALLIFKENETFAITGDSPANFSLNKIWDDGCLSAASIVQYKSTIIWAGRNGVYLFDGTKITNLVDRSLGSTWQNYIAPFDTRIHRLTGAVYQDHYFLSNSSVIGGVGNPPYSLLKNGVSNPFQVNCISVYIPGKALSYHTAPILIGSARVGLSTYFTDKAGYVCDFALLFAATPNQKDYSDIHANPWTPDPCFEGKWMSMKDPLRKKMFKQILTTLGDGANGVTWPVVVEVAPGLGPDSTAGSWTVLGATFPTTGTSYTSRIKFLRRERYVRVKMYQNVVANSAPGLWSLRRFAIAFKLQKLGRL